MNIDRASPGNGTYMDDVRAGLARFEDFDDYTEVWWSYWISVKDKLWISIEGQPQPVYAYPVSLWDFLGLSRKAIQFYIAGEQNLVKAEIEKNYPLPKIEEIEL